MADSTSMRVVMAVAEHKGVDHTDLPPLYTAIDSEALDALFDSRNRENERRRSDRELQFSYAGHEVSVRNGDVTVRSASRQVETAADD